VSRRGRVMIVDDDPAILVALTRVLGLQHDVTAASSPAEAVAHIQRGERFDAIILDVVMPGMTGIELYELWVRELPTVADAVIFLTAGGFTAESERFLRSMGERCLQKPVDIASLRRFIDARVAAAKS